MIRSTRLTLAAILLTSGGVMAQQATSSGPGETKDVAADAVANFGESPSNVVIPPSWPYAGQSSPSATKRVPAARTRTETSPQLPSRGTSASTPNDVVQIQPRLAEGPLADDRAGNVASEMPVIPTPWPYEAVQPKQPQTENVTDASQSPDAVPFPQPLDDELDRFEADESADVNNIAARGRRPLIQNVPAVRSHQKVSADHDAPQTASRQSEQDRRRRSRPRSRRYRVASLDVISSHADDHVRYGFALAEKGAVHSARGEFVEALSIIADALDVEGGASYRTALIAGLRALDEANDFTRQGKPIDSTINFRRLRDVHKTPVLADADLQALSPYVVMQQYFAFAEQKLAYAGGGMPAASRALYGLGRIQPFLAGQEGPGDRLAGPKGIALHRAALTTDPRNHQAANELGVQLARYGQLAEAAGALKHSLSVRPVPEAWHNLARVYEQQGEQQQARLARAKHAALITAVRQGYDDGGETAVRWVEPADFAPSSARANIAESTTNRNVTTESLQKRTMTVAPASPIQRIGRLFGRVPRR